MREHILVCWNQRDTLYEVIPYLDEIAQPGMRVVFLMRRPLSNCAWMAAHFAALQTGSWGAFEHCKRASLKSTELSAEPEFKEIREALRRRGLQSEVKFYGGSVRKILEDLLDKYDVRFVMMPATIEFSWFSLLRQIALGLRWVRRSTTAPVLLFQPDSSGHDIALLRVGVLACAASKADGC